MIESSGKSSTAVSMWFINFTLVVGILISLLVFGWATYLEGARPVTKVMGAISGPVPLPMSRPRPKDFAVQEPVEEVVAKEPRPARQRAKLRNETW